MRLIQHVVVNLSPTCHRSISQLHAELVLRNSLNILLPKLLLLVRHTCSKCLRIGISCFSVIDFATLHFICVSLVLKVYIIIDWGLNVRVYQLPFVSYVLIRFFSSLRSWSKQLFWRILPYNYFFLASVRALRHHVNIVFTFEYSELHILVFNSLWNFCLRVTEKLLLR